MTDFIDAAAARPPAPTEAPPVAGDSTPLHIAVGDIHGMRAELDTLLAMIEADSQDRDKVVVFLGDFVNRGPASRQVLGRLIEGPRRAGERWIYLRGNHDQMFIDALATKSERGFAEFLRKGGEQTLASYGLIGRDATPERARRTMPGEQPRFLEATAFSHIAGSYVFVHAGVDPDRPLDAQRRKTLLNVRRPFLRKAHRLACTVVHGHVPNPKGPVVARGRIGVDTAAHATGILTAVVLDQNMGYRFLATSPK